MCHVVIGCLISETTHTSKTIIAIPDNEANVCMCFWLCCANRDCSRLMVTFHQKAGTGKLTGVYRKYSSSKFDQMAKAQPADFLLDL